ncbi:MAG: AbrB family transcriptional regulator [Rhodocyclaceae bacterium]|nr:AbrB family transcriptional regulator [Rhodocyclaceae bacterium]
MPTLLHAGRLARLLLPYCLTLLAATLAALAARRLHVPLPWMLGPLFTVAALRVGGLPLRAPPGGRQAGQWAIGTALGLYFTPQVVALIVDNAALVGGFAAASVGIGVACARLTYRFGRVDRPTAFFAALPGGASEMAVVAERFGGAVDLIAAAHAIRVLLVVALVPVALTLSGAHGSDVFQPLAAEVRPEGLPALLLAGLGGCGLMGLARIGNAWVLGPLLGVGLMTALGWTPSALPPWMVNGGQLLLGTALGCRFAPGFFRSAPRFLAAAAGSSLLAILLGLALALVAAPLSGAPLATLVLAAAPGGVAEMCITAKVLQLGVPLVTVCHALRVIVLTLAAPAVYRALSRSRP